MPELVPERAVEDEEVKVLWDINVQCNNVIEARRPDIIVIVKKEGKGIIIDIAVPAELKREREIGRLWKLKMVEVVPVVTGALGSFTKEFDRWIQKLGITYNVGVMHKTALLGTAKISRKVLEI